MITPTVTFDAPLKNFTFKDLPKEVVNQGKFNTYKSDNGTVEYWSHCGNIYITKIEVIPEND